MSATHKMLIDTLVKSFSQFPQVEAVAVGGSQASGIQDSTSDIDLYVYTTSTIPLSKRAALVKKLKASQKDLNLQIWDLGDQWYDAKTSIEIDVIYWDTQWIEAQLDRVLSNYQASAGYSTCFWYTIYHSQIFYDKKNWFHLMKQKSKQAYPEKLREAIIATNHALLRRIIPSYLHQIEKAAQRSDSISVNHRVAALLASYFDVLFALNRVLHPGEKRLLEFALKHCVKIPRKMSDNIQEILQSPNPNLITNINQLIDQLDQLLKLAGFDPQTSQPYETKNV